MVKRSVARRAKRKESKEEAPTGPHTPISNIITEGERVRTSLISQPESGSAQGMVDLSKLEKQATRELGARVAAESIQMPRAAKKLWDVGRASFRDPEVVLETVHGKDDRVQVQDTDKYPHRAVASLLITARDGSQWLGTAWFISPRTLITAGHCVYITNSPIPERNGWVKSIQVMPGRNDGRLPFGSVTSTHFWSVKGWAASGDENFDYGAIVIPTELGLKVDAFGFVVESDSELLNTTAFVSGYPADKDEGTMWIDTKKIASTGPSKVIYDIDTAGGQSGAAVYAVKDGKPLALAVHAYGGATTNSGTRITTPVFQNLTNWKA